MGNARLRTVDFFRGTRALPLYREYLVSQWLPPDRIRKRQWESLWRLLHHAYNHVPYYRDMFTSLGAHPLDIRSMDDFRSLPLLTKDIIRRNGVAMHAAEGISRPFVLKSTGGSTGNTLRYRLDRMSNSAHWASIYRQWHIGGWLPGDPLVYFGGASLRPSLHALGRHVYVRLNNWTTFSSFHLTEANMDRWLRVLRGGGVHFMHGYASSIAQLAGHARRSGFPRAILRSVWTCAEPLLPHHRAEIEGGFGCEVFDFYGANDGGGFAFECERHDGLHVVAEKCLMEIMRNDGTEATDGEEGEVVTTDLLNYAMPFIRYRVGDVALAGHSACPCGRGLPLLRRIQGRSHDFIVTPGGEKVHGEFFSHLIGGVPWVRQFQVRQETPVGLHVWLRPVGDPAAQDLERINAVIRSKFPAMEVRIEITALPLESPGGKFRSVINMTGQG